MPSRREVYLMDGFKPTLGPKKLDMSKFPTFRDGDVKVIISGSRQYQLHKSILRNSSPVFRDLLSDENTVTLSKKAKKKGVVVTNVIRAVINEDTEDDKLPVVLVPLELDEDGKTVSDMRLGLDLENGLMAPPVYTAFDKVLAAFYHHPINLSDHDDSGLRHILMMAVEVLRVAEYLECVPVVTQYFEATLLAMNQTVYRSISKAPATWLPLAVRMQSKPIYREAITHAIGQYKTDDVQAALPDLDDVTRNFIESKANAIIRKLREATSNMLSYYPMALQRTKKTSLVDKEENSRNSYGGDILHWMALVIFRQWLSHQIAVDHTHQAPDLGFNFTKLVRQGGGAYLPDPELQLWHTYFPMSARSRNVIENRLAEIKAHVKDWTRGFFWNASKLDVAQYPTGFFTCIGFDGERFPWEEVTEYTDSELDGDEEDESKMDVDKGENGGLAVAKSGKSGTSDKSSQTAQTMDTAGTTSSTMLVSEERKASKDAEYGDGDFEAELVRMDSEYKKARIETPVRNRKAQQGSASDDDSDGMMVPTIPIRRRL